MATKAKIEAEPVLSPRSASRLDFGGIPSRSPEAAVAGASATGVRREARADELEAALDDVLERRAELLRRLADA